MKRTALLLAVAFTLGFVAALPTVSGCSKPADRTLRIRQYQSTKTYSGAFRIDTSQLDPNAITSKSETGGPGAPVTEIELAWDHEIEVVLRPLVTAPKSNATQPNAAEQAKFDHNDN